MNATVKNAFGITVIDISGRLDVETTLTFRNTSQKLANKRVTFNLKKLSFVGSTGIVPFIDAIKACVTEHHSRINFCDVGIDFLKVLQASQLRLVPCFEVEQKAVEFHLLHPELDTQICEDNFVLQKDEDIKDLPVDGFQSDDSDNEDSVA